MSGGHEWTLNEQFDLVDHLFPASVKHEPVLVTRPETYPPRRLHIYDPINVLIEQLRLIGNWSAMHEDLRESARCAAAFAAIAVGLKAYIRAS